jgi:hypothetical protein
MEPTTLQDEFNSLLPINGDKCKDILKKIYPGYKENKEYTNDCIYVGHSEIVDYETGIKARAPPKVGKSRYLTALNRGRSQGGCDWIFDFIYFVSKEENYSKLETLIHNKLHKYNLNKDCHKELYDLSIEETIDKVKHIIGNLHIKKMHPDVNE